MQPFHLSRQMFTSLCIATLFGGIGWGAEPPTGEQQFEVLQKRYQTEQARLRAGEEKTTDEERSRLQNEYAAMLGDFLNLEEEQRGTTPGISSLYHLVTIAARYSFNPVFPGTVPGRQALSILATHYADHPDLDLFFFWLTINDVKASGGKAFLEQNRKSPHRHVRAAALDEVT